MLKKIIALLTVMTLASLSLPSLAAKDGEKGPSDRAYDRASDNASFKRDDDKDGKKHNKKRRVCFISPFKNPPKLATMILFFI